MTRHAFPPPYLWKEFLASRSKDNKLREPATLSSASPHRSASVMIETIFAVTPRPLILRAIALTAVCAAIYGPLWCRQPVVATISLFVSTLFLCAGLILLEDPQNRRTGTLAILVPIAWSAGWLVEWGAGPLPLISALSEPFAVSLLLVMLFTHMNPGSIRNSEQVFIWVTSMWMAGGEVARAEVNYFNWPHGTWLIGVPLAPQFHDFVDYWFQAGQVALACVFTSLWLLRFPRLRSISYDSLMPIVAALCAGVGVCVQEFATLFKVEGSSLDYIWDCETGLWMAIPLFFLVSVIRLRNKLLLSSKLASSKRVGMSKDVEHSLSTTIVQARPSKLSLGVTHLAISLLSDPGRAMFAEELLDELFDMADQGLPKKSHIRCAFRQILSVRDLRALSGKAQHLISEE